MKVVRIAGAVLLAVMAGYALPVAFVQVVEGMKPPTAPKQNAGDLPQEIFQTMFMLQQAASQLEDRRSEMWKVCMGTAESLLSDDCAWSLEVAEVQLRNFSQLTSRAIRQIEGYAGQGEITISQSEDLKHSIDSNFAEASSRFMLEIGQVRQKVGSVSIR